MKLNSLFKVLVVGGAALGVNTTLAQEATPKPPVPQEELAPAFCGTDYPGSCVATIVNGNECAIVPAPGLECCWGTSCYD